MENTVMRYVAKAYDDEIHGHEMMMDYDEMVLI